MPTNSRTNFFSERWLSILIAFVLVCTPTRMMKSHLLIACGAVAAVGIGAESMERELTRKHKREPKT